MGIPSFPSLVKRFARAVTVCTETDCGDGDERFDEPDPRPFKAAKPGKPFDKSRRG